MCEHIAVLIQSIPQGDPADSYSAALTMDVGSLQPSRGALEAACRWLRTTAMFRPKISEVLAAVREAGIMYETALRALESRRTERCECGRSRLLRLLRACGFTASAAGRERTASAFL